MMGAVSSSSELECAQPLQVSEKALEALDLVVELPMHMAILDDDHRVAPDEEISRGKRRSSEAIASSSLR
jgi:hypothetical protein